MASASSNAAMRAGQMPSPYFGRSNIEQAYRRKRMTPDFQDQVGPLQLLQQPDRGIGVDLDDREASRIPADIRKQVDGGSVQAERADGLLRKRQRVRLRRGKRHAAAGAQVHPAGNFPAFAQGRDLVEIAFRD